MSVDRRWRVIAAVTSGLLAAGASPLLAAGSASAAGPAVTALTAEQFASSLSRVQKATSRKAMREGVRSTYRFVRTNLPDSPVFDETVEKGVVTVDAKRQTIRRAITRSVPMFEETTVVAGPRYCVDRGHLRWTVAEQGVGRWVPVTAHASRAAALVGRDGVRWEKRAKPKSVRALFAREGVGRLFERGALLDVPQYSAATRSVTATGAVYEADFVRGRGFVTGHVVVTVDQDGALVALAVKAAAGDGHWALDHQGRNVFGPRTVKPPKVERTIGAKQLTNACRAAGTRAFVRWEADWVAFAATIADRSRPGATVGEIRHAARFTDDGGPYRLDVRVVPIEYGVMIVGRHKLLPHPVVSTVFIRDGKAVAHKVR